MSKVFKPMRSVAPDAKFPVRYPMMASRKLDGIRCCIHEGKAITKSGKPVPNAHIRQWLEYNVPNGFDGELISGSPSLDTVYGTTFSAVMKQAGEPEFSFYVFDLCNSDLPAVERCKLLAIRCELLDDRVVFVEQSIVNTDTEVEALYESYLAEGYEGMILKSVSGLYKFGRATPKSQEQLKLKPEDDFEGEILDCYEAQINENEAFTNEVGETKRSTHAENKVGKGMVGGYLVKDVLTDAVFKVGPGKMTHAQRVDEWEKFLADATHRIGGFLKYRCMSYGTMTNNAARHGRWIGWRDVTDMNPEEVLALSTT